MDIAEWYFILNYYRTSNWEALRYIRRVLIKKWAIRIYGWVKEEDWPFKKAIRNVNMLNNNKLKHDINAKHNTGYKLI